MGNNGDGLNLPLEAAEQPDGLSDVQRANLARVQARLGVDEYENPNLADTPARLAEHGFVFKGGRSDLTKG